ncbi:MAG: aspartate aminotransferase family protein [Verrucomicrobiota bacterium]
MINAVENVSNLYDKHVMSTYKQNLVLTKGKGTKVWDINGKVYLDFVSGISVLNVGYSHPAVVSAIQQQAEKLIHVSNLYYNQLQPWLAEKLSSVSLKGKCFFCNSGAGANEALIKLARLWGHESGRYEIVTMRNSFHGRTLATAAATGQTKVQKGFEPMPEGFVLADFNDIDSVKKAVGEKTVAVLVEAVQGEGGIVPATEDFMTGLRAFCDEKNLLLLCDEVQCGMGRTGKWFGYQHYGIEPDAISVAKSLGSGYPIGAIVAGKKVSDVFQPGHHASTFGGGPLACAAALATLGAIEDDRLLDRAEKTGKVFRSGLEKFVEKYEKVAEVRGKGLMLGMVLDCDARQLADEMADIGLLTLATAGNVIRFLPPLNVKGGEVEEALDIIDDCIARMHGVGEDEAVDTETAPGGEEAAKTGEQPNVEKASQEPGSAENSHDA